MVLMMIADMIGLGGQSPMVKSIAGGAVIGAGLYLVLPRATFAPIDRIPIIGPATQFQGMPVVSGAVRGGLVGAAAGAMM